jgi:starch phosphorylase
MKPLRVLMLSAEIFPFAKTGGVADVVGSLPIALKQLDVDVRLAMPRYGVVPAEKVGLRPLLDAFDVPLAQSTDKASVWQSSIADEIPVYFIENARLYERDGIYMFHDDAERFIFYSRAALEMCRRLNWQPDVIHCHEWHTALVPNWLKTIYADDPFFRETACVYTIHNLAFQGIFGQRVLEIAGLGTQSHIAQPEASTDPNQVDFMARGISHADAITTVSERHAQEILTPEFGEKLDSLLRSRKDRLFGILNGIDYDLYNPKTDTNLMRHYHVDSLHARRDNKLFLQRELGLTPDADVPIIGMISRLIDQKGMYLVRDLSEKMLALNVQLIVQGIGDADLQRFCGELQTRHVGRVVYVPNFSAATSAKIFGGSDIYLMPSRYEPAGTNQMIALRYGVVPIARVTGGLADTVQDYDPRTSEGNGFTFQHMDMWECYAAIVRAVELYKHRDVWRRIQQNGMRYDLSWSQSAERYVGIYRFAIQKKQATLEQQQTLSAEIARTARIIAALPSVITRLGELAYNLWWAWQPAAQHLFELIDVALWHSLARNPVKFLREVRREKLEQAANDPTFRADYAQVMQQFDAYVQARNTWHGATYPNATNHTIAYFSFEFGLHESLPIYSGGLGILAGDTLKEASDLGLPLVAVGFLYPQGFFRQQIDLQGNQIALAEKVNFAEVPAVAIRGHDGKHVTIGVELPGRTIYAQLWRIQVGRIPLIMMDTDIEQNTLQDRKLLAQLYVGDQESRIAQEMVLGIGGVRAVRAAGYQPTVWHMNEGHAAFLLLELARELTQNGKRFADIANDVRRQTMFTTHTPVPAGNDAFPPDLMDKYFHAIYTQLGLTRDEFMELALHDGRFSMTVLALKLSAHANGVSKLHGEVSRQMWGWLWPGLASDQVPIRSITNGVHTATWLAPDLAPVYAKYLGHDWYDHLDDAKTWDALAMMPDEELWHVHQQQKQKLIQLVRAQAIERLNRLGQSHAVAQVENLLDPNILTIGFARRFATYKRATLIFREVERLKRMVYDLHTPMQILFAGKSHPADQPGQTFIRQVYQYSQVAGLRGRIHFVEEYNMHLARHLVAGVDVWLNNPRKPLEASGTSGMKAALNGAPNASILDGWWAEGYNGANGWDIVSADARHIGEEEQDAQDANSLYATFEQQIIPLYYQRDEQGIPRAWVQKMKEAIRSVAPQFSTRRMVKEYVGLWREGK